MDSEEELKCMKKLREDLRATRPPKSYSAVFFAIFAVLIIIGTLGFMGKLPFLPKINFTKEFDRR